VSRILEVCPEPGRAELWLTFDDGLTHRVDLFKLLVLERYRALRLPAVFARARIDDEGARLTWPGGAHLTADMVLHAQDGTLPITTVAVVPAAQRYRPLLPCLHHLQPADSGKLTQRHVNNEDTVVGSPSKTNLNCL
jgi:Protein of unknown function (DUF2442)